MNIKEIAQKAGVSTATVSRVLNNSTLVKEKTKEQVLRVIDEFDYAPSAIAKSLSVQNTHNIGVIFPDIENPFFSGALKGISQIAEKNLYNVFLFNSDETSQREREFLNVVRHQRLDGVIISPANGYDETLRSVLEGFEKQGIAVVLFDRKLKNGVFSSVTAEDKKGAYMAVKRLIEEGHRKIAIIEGDPSNHPVYERTLGYRQAMAEAKIPLENRYIVKADQKSELAYLATKKLMNLEDPPTAIFTCNNMMTLGCLRYFTEHNIIVGKDIALIGFDDIEVLRLIDYKLSVVDRSEQDMGQIAMELLLERIRQPGSEVKEAVVPTELILRGSEKLQI